MLYEEQIRVFYAHQPEYGLTEFEYQTFYIKDGERKNIVNKVYCYRQNDFLKLINEWNRKAIYTKEIQYIYILHKTLTNRID